MVSGTERQHRVVLDLRPGLWDKVRGHALTPCSRLAGWSPCDLRLLGCRCGSAEVSRRLRGCQRAGHSVDVLEVYAECIEGDRMKVNKVVEDAFAELNQGVQRTAAGEPFGVVLRFAMVSQMTADGA